MPAPDTRDGDDRDDNPRDSAPHDDNPLNRDERDSNSNPRNSSPHDSDQRDSGQRPPRAPVGPSDKTGHRAAARRTDRGSSDDKAARRERTNRGTADRRRTWREPAAALPLRWGTYRPRLVAGIAMLFVGTGCILATTAYSLPFLLVGSLLQPAGWAVLPSTIGRRVAVPVPVLGFSWLMLGGSGFAWCYAVVLAAWLLARLRPLAAYTVLVLPLGASLVMTRIVSTYERGWITILTMTLVVVAAAWIARGINIGVDSWQSVRSLRNQQDRFDAQETLTGPDPKRGMHGTHQSGLLEQPGVPEQRPDRDGRHPER